MNSICNPNKCTSCKACLNICSNNAISFIKDELDCDYATIDSSKCVDCGLCSKVCPINSFKITNQIKKCFASWSNADHIRKNSASGGICTEFYNYFISNNFNVVGVIQNSDFIPEYIITRKLEDIHLFQNSKYAQSNPKLIYKEIIKKLRNNEKVFFVGLPCHVAAIKNLIKLLKVNDKNFFCADLICHGVPPVEYLQQYLKQYPNFDQLNYRDPLYKTYNFTLTLKSKGEIIHHAKPYSKDNYQNGFHNGFIYRKSCYQCKFATLNRPGDLTLSDFSGLGSLSEFNYSKLNVSSILINNEKGQEMVENITKNGKITAIERDPKEMTMFEHRLSKPTEISNERLSFISKYKDTHNFITSSNYEVKKLNRNYKINYILTLRWLKNIIKKIIKYDNR